MDLKPILRYLHFNESEKIVPMHPSMGCIGTAHGGLWDTTETSIFQH